MIGITPKGIRMQQAISELLPILKNVTIFAGLTDETIAQIYNACGTVSFPAGEIIIRESTPGDHIYIILRGFVKIVLNLDTDPMEITRFGAGNCLGEVSLIGILNHSASVVAIDYTELLVISRKFLLDIVKDDKTLFSMLVLNIARELARRLYKTNEILLHYGNTRNS
jgi:CRP-like cAMP-binding protein